MSEELRNFTRADEFLSWWLEEPRLSEGQEVDLRRYYKSYTVNFGKHIRYWYSYQIDAMTDRIKKNSGLSILDVGCGCGTETLWMAMNGASVVGLDVSPEKIEVANARKAVLEKQGFNLDVSFICEGVMSLDTLQKWDVIWMEQAFHHLEPRDKVVLKLDSLLEDNGELVFIEANAWNPLLQWLLFRGRGFNTVIEHEGTIWGNERIIVPLALINLFDKLGYSKKKLEYFRVLPNRNFSNELLTWERITPQVLKPAFTHYHLILQK